MSQLAKILGAYAPGHPLEHNGKTFTFNRVTQKVKAALELAYFKRKRETVYLIKEELSEQEYDRQLSHVTDAYSSGRYAFPMGESFAYFMGAGVAELVTHLTGCERTDAEQLIADRQLDVMHLCLCVTVESFPDLKKKLMTSKAASKIDLTPLLDLLTPS